jgi:hypothetical protein
MGHAEIALYSGEMIPQVELVVAIEMFAQCGHAGHLIEMAIGHGALDGSQVKHGSFGCFAGVHELAFTGTL